MNDELWLSFYTTTGSNLKFMLPNELFQVLHAAKKEKGKGLNVIIRTPDKVQKATIDTIVEKIKSNGISNYSIIKMSDEELETVITAVENWKAPMEIELTMPKDEPEEHAVQEEKNCITVILLAADDCWCYPDTSISRGALYNIKEFQHFMSEKKKEFGDSILVIIKPTAQANYKATVDALDQMTINQIKRYAMVKLHEVEERFLSAKGLIELPAPVEIITPNTVTTQEIPNENAFLIEIRKDNSVWYQPISPLIKMAPQKVNAPITKNLKDIIADYEKSSPGKIKTYLIKADGDAKYPKFEEVINALKENNIYKYKLVTSEN
jgi:biopolymer transport protein ExbD